MQPSFEIKFHPVDLKRHGVNPYGESIYRVVWADSRITKARHHGKVITLPRYMHGDEGAAAGHWVLEKWLSGEVVLGMTREQYASFLTQFPDAVAEEYPERGDYEMSIVFPGEVDETALHLYLDRQEFLRRTMTDNDRKLNLEANADAKEQAATEKFNDAYDEAKEASLA